MEEFGRRRIQNELVGTYEAFTLPCASEVHLSKTKQTKTVIAELDILET